LLCCARFSIDCRANKPGATALAVTTLGLIYVNPAGPMGVPDPQASAYVLRTPTHVHRHDLTLRLLFSRSAYQSWLDAWHAALVIVCLIPLLTTTTTTTAINNHNDNHNADSTSEPRSPAWA
jgi:hypothetical protein